MGSNPFKSIENAVKKAAKQVERGVSRESRKILGDELYDVGKGVITINPYGGTYLAGRTASASNPVKAAGDLVASTSRSLFAQESNYREGKALERAGERANQRALFELEKKMTEAELAKKAGMLAEMGSSLSDDRGRSYLGEGGTTGGYVDEKELAKKKKLGGSK